MVKLMKLASVLTAIFLADAAEYRNFPRNVVVVSTEESSNSDEPYNEPALLQTSSSVRYMASNTELLPELEVIPEWILEGVWDLYMLSQCGILTFHLYYNESEEIYRFDVISEHTYDDAQ